MLLMVWSYLDGPSSGIGRVRIVFGNAWVTLVSGVRCCLGFGDAVRTPAAQKCRVLANSRLPTCPGPGGAGGQYQVFGCPEGLPHESRAEWVRVSGFFMRLDPGLLHESCAKGVRVSGFFMCLGPGLLQELAGQVGEGLWILHAFGSWVCCMSHGPSG